MMEKMRLGDMKFLREYGCCLLNPEMMPTAFKVALIVGSLLFLINHGSAWLSGTMTGDRWLSAGFSYLVPYGVNIHGQYISHQRKKIG
jgi:hypothetical protein